jgi:hypothetical protein
MRRYASIAVLARGEHARFMLNEYVAQGRQVEPFSEVQRDIEALAKIGKVAPAGLFFLEQYLRARIAWLRGDRHKAIEHLRTVVCAAEAPENPHFRALNQQALGVVLGDSEGAKLRSEAEQCIRDLGVVDVAADLNAYFPELAELR